MIVDGKYYDGVTQDAAREILRALPETQGAARKEAEK
jgi:hypothetical protein